MIEINGTEIELSEVWEQITDDELCDEVRKRSLEDAFQDDDDGVDEEDIYEEVYDEFERKNFILPKDFDRFKLRDHLVSIAGLGSYVTEKILFDKLSDLLDFS